MRAGRTVAAMLAAALIAGCAATLDPQGFTDEAANLIPQEKSADKALSALTRGDYANAERYAIGALRRNPKDPYALITAGLVYQASGRFDLARQYYEVIITNQPQATIMIPGDGSTGPRSVVDVAVANLAAIDKITGRSTNRDISQSGRAPGSAVADPGRAPTTRLLAGPQAIEDAVPPSAQAAMVPSRLPPSHAEANLAARFRALKRLLDEGLITQEEFARRRAANLGALLPYATAVAAAQGLERPTPPEDQIVERLRALALALENRGITPRELAVERTTILEALMPADPRRVELPPLPPRDMIEAAQSVGRLERLRSTGLITAEEMAREKEATERALDGTLSTVRVAGTASGLRHGKPAAVPASNGKAGAAGFGVQLATLRSEEAAAKAWEGLKTKYPEQLSKLEAGFKQVQLADKGVRWKLLAGPLPTQDAAKALCKTLKLHRQACDPAPFEKPAAKK